ncbi:MAG: UvrD-helicase domain-containing protein, partial [Proteobacteria bacterium]|nr:UvrD-helicase domain-containing protein [Pseudomonadota bacterium]
GKTRVLTHRIAWLISQGVAPSAILAITFTNKAAREMRERAMALIPEEDHAGLQLSTFHAFGARFLRKYATYAGLESSFSIYAENEQKTLIKDIMKQFGIIGSNTDLTESETQKQKAAVSDYLNTIMSWKEAGKSVEEAQTDAKSRETQHMADVYIEYEKQLVANNAVDFCGLLLWPLYILKNYENVRCRVQARYRHILVDEFQDTNGVQLQLLRQLCGPGAQLTVVGDDDQSIYTWRGADPTAILEFETRFGACDVFKLEQNYRSTKPILTCAGNLIAYNTARTEKRLWTNTEGGEKVHVISYDSDWDEAADVISQMISRHNAARISWEKFAILYRRNSQSVSFERECTHNAIPYQIIGATGFYDREEIVDLISYLRVLVNPADTIALRRIINKPNRGIGEKTCDKIIELMDQKTKSFGFTPTQCLISLLEDISAGRVKIPRAGAKVAEGCNALLALFSRVENWRTCSPRDTLLAILDETNFMVHLKKATIKKGQDFAEAEDRIHSLIQELDAHQAKSPNDLPGFLEDMTLIRPESDDSKRAVNLMTIHSAKGLEFDVVYIVGVSDGTLPLRRSGECNLEEERRLMYVAMTRARKVLNITYAQKTHTFGQLNCQEPSPFIDEMQRPEDSETIDLVHIDTPNDYIPRRTPQLAWSSIAKKAAAQQAQKPRDFENEVGGGYIRPFKSKKQPADFEPDLPYEEEAHDIYEDIQPQNAASKQAPAPAPSRKPFTWKDSKRPDSPAALGVSAEVRMIGNSAVSATSKNGKKLVCGSRVTHSIHGVGTVLKLEASGNDYKATVQFLQAGVRTIIARFLWAI